MKYLFITLLALVIFSCDNKKQKTKEELAKIAYREAEFGMTKDEVLKLNICKECYVFSDAILLNQRYSKIGSHNWFIELYFDNNNLLYKVLFYGKTQHFNDMKVDIEYLKNYVAKDYKEPHISSEYKKETLLPLVIIYGWKLENERKIITIDIIRANQWSDSYRAELCILYFPEESELNDSPDSNKEEPTKL